MSRRRTVLALAAATLVCVGFTGAKDQRQAIYVRNASTLTSDAEIRKALPAFQQALDRDFGPAWQTGARLVFIGHAQAPRGSWRIVLVDLPNCVGCGGFHEWLGRYARAEVGHDQWQLTFTHELFEMIADPRVSNDGSGGRMIASGNCAYLVEVGDPVENDSYRIDGVTISDFALRAWYSGEPGPYDFLGLLSAPHTLRPGGYSWSVCGTWSEL